MLRKHPTGCLGGLQERGECFSHLTPALMQKIQASEGGLLETWGCTVSFSSADGGTSPRVSVLFCEQTKGTSEERQPCLRNPNSFMVHTREEFSTEGPSWAERPISKEPADIQMCSPPRLGTQVASASILSNFSQKLKIFLSLQPFRWTNYCSWFLLSSKIASMFRWLAPVLNDAWGPEGSMDFEITSKTNL